MSTHTLQPLFEQPASIGSGGLFQACVTIAGPHGSRIVLFQGQLHHAERLAACWNAQLGVPTERIVPVINPDA